MLEEPNILQEIVGNVDDLGTRLIYADWLDERGDPRGEFIRLQCESASSPPSDRKEELDERCKELLDEHFEQWAGKLLERGVARREIQFRFGDIDGLELGPRTFQSLRHDFDSVAPLVRCLTLIGAEEIVGYLNDWQPLQRAVQLTFRFSEEIPQQVGPLIRGLATLPNLLAICFNRNAFGNDLLRALAASNDFPKLCALDLESVILDDDGVTELVSNFDLVGKLIWLNLAFNQITSSGVRTLVNAGAIDQLQNLRLRGNAIVADDIPLLRRRFGSACDLVRLYDRFEC